MDCDLEMVEDLSWIYSTKIRNFQFKFLQTRTATNSFLSKCSFRDCSLLFVQNRQGNNNPSFLGMFCDENLSGNGSIHLIPASYVLDIYEYLGFRREKDDILVSRCLLLARYNINCFKFKKTSPSIREYAQQLKYNLQIEKETSIVTDSQKKFQQKWHKIMHCNCYIVCGQAPNVSLLAAYICISYSPYPDLKPLKINFLLNTHAVLCFFFKLSLLSIALTM